MTRKLLDGMSDEDRSAFAALMVKVKRNGFKKRRQQIVLEYRPQQPA